MEKKNRSAYYRDYYLHHRESILAKQKSKRTANLKKAREYGRESIRRQREKSPERYRAYTRKSKLKQFCEKVGITLEDFHRFNQQQNGRCRLCGEPPISGFRLLVDHSHITGKFRGLLCTGCNTGLGMFRDNPNLLRKAAEYVEKDKKQ